MTRYCTVYSNVLWNTPSNTHLSLVVRSKCSLESLREVVKVSYPLMQLPDKFFNSRFTSSPNNNSVLKVLIQEAKVDNPHIQLLDVFMYEFYSLS